MYIIYIYVIYIYIILDLFMDSFYGKFSEEAGHMYIQSSWSRYGRVNTSLTTMDSLLFDLLQDDCIHYNISDISNFIWFQMVIH